MTPITPHCPMSTALLERMIDMEFSAAYLFELEQSHVSLDDRFENTVRRHTVSVVLPLLEEICVSLPWDDNTEKILRHRTREEVGKCLAAAISGHCNPRMLSV